METFGQLLKRYRLRIPGSTNGNRFGPARPSLSQRDLAAARGERDALLSTARSRMAMLEAALAQEYVHVTVDGWIACRGCSATRRLTEQELTDWESDGPFAHADTCLLAAPNPSARAGR